MARSLAKGSFAADDLESPTMESLESREDSQEMQLPSNRGDTMGRFASDYDEEHCDSGVASSAHVTKTSSRCRSPPTLGAPVSDRSLGSQHSTDQVLELSSAIDLTNNEAILVRYNKHNYNRQQSLENQEQPQKTPSPVKVTRPANRVLSRRPSIHETHEIDDCCEECTKSEFLFYLYSLAILGTSMRIFIGRLFGQDCENPGEIADFLSPLSEQICVTATGETLQRGGALFVALPTNILGCFIMGLVSSSSPENGLPGGKLPWLHKDHPLQQHGALHHAIKIGLCGSLTTWSSWNAQMVTMMDGTDTELGSQVVPAIFGYIIGMSSAVASFQAGGRCYEWLYNWSNSSRQTSSKWWPRAMDEEDQEQPTSWDSEDSHHKSSNSSPRQLAGRSYSARRLARASKKKAAKDRPPYVSLFLHKVLPFLIVVVLLVLYGVADGVMGIQFYKELWACCILTPVGVHLRWKLAAFNGRGIGPNHRLDWVPWGTLVCNLMASVIAVVFQALRVHYLRNGEDGLKYPWVVAIVVGMKTGFSGSLSTVSSMVKEIMVLRTLYPIHAKATFYGCFTIILSMILGLSVYSPLMRYG